MVKNRLLQWGSIAAGALFLLVSNIWYINATFHTIPGYRFTGANPYASADKLVYQSMVEQGREGIIFMRNLHTTEPQKGLLLSPLWFAIGQTAYIVNVSNNAAYQSFRILFTLLFLWMLYQLLTKLFRRSSDRFFSLLVVLFSGGLGWLYLLRHFDVIQTSGLFKFLYSPIDLYVTEGNTLLNFSQSPLFALSQLLLLLIFYWFIRDAKANSYGRYFLVAALVALLGVLHPYDLPVIAAVLGSWSIWYLYQTKDFKILIKLAIVLVGMAAAAGYTVYVFFAEPVMQEWYKQNLVYSPSLINFLWGYGFLIPLWITGVIVLMRTKRRDSWWMLILIWSTIIWILLYTPLNINRRFMNGWHIALALVSYSGLRYLYEQCKRLWLKTALVSASIVGLLSGIVFYLFISLYFTPATYALGYYYVTINEDKAIAYLRAHTVRNDGLLTSDMKLAFRLSSSLNRPVFRGHDHQTPRYQLKQQQMDWFFSEHETARAGERKRQFLKDNNIAYVVVSQVSLGRPVLWLSGADFLEQVAEYGDILIFRVQGFEGVSRQTPSQDF